MPTETPIDAGRVMDVRAIPCATKHGLILQTWCELPVGGHFILLNDRDPVRLQEQFTAQWPDTFTWEYLLRGPEEFRIKIAKLKRLDGPPVATRCGG